jgi:hypothetical protein
MCESTYMATGKPKIVVWGELHTARYEASLRMIPQVKAWREREFDAGRPSDLQDYWNSQGSDFCSKCQSVGIAMVESDGLTAFKAVGCEGDVQFWEECSECDGTGRMTSNESAQVDNQRDDKPNF